MGLKPTVVFQAGVRDSFEENVPVVYFEMKLQNNPKSRISFDL